MAACFSATSQPAHRYGLAPSGKLGPMEITNPTHARVRARDAAFRLLQRLTLGAAVGAFAGVAVFAAVSAATIPGTSTSQASNTSSTSSTSSSTSSSSSSGLQSSSGVRSSSGVLWYTTRGAGAVTLILLSCVVVLGILSTLRVQSASWPRFLTTALHRNLALMTLVFLALHIVTAVVDPFTNLGWAAALIPFSSS